MKPVRKAVFPVAGFGTRFLPATKAMPEGLLPIVDKPLIQYATEEAIAAGIDTLIFVTRRNKRAIEDHFDSNQELEAALRAKGKTDQADMVRNILSQGDDSFAVLLVDDFLTYNGAGVTADLVKNYEVSGRTQLSVIEVNGPDISKYGVVQPGAAAGSGAGLVEKPGFEQAPSNQASIGRYVLTPDIFEILRSEAPGASGEIQLADAINKHAAAGNLAAVTLNGQRFDCGSVKGFLEAIMHVARWDGLV